MWLTQVLLSLISAATWQYGITALLAWRARIRTWWHRVPTQSPTPADTTAESGLVPGPAQERVDWSRRELLRVAVMDAPVALGVTGAAASILIEPWRLDVSEHTFAIKDLPQGLDGMRLVHITDTHLGPHVPREFLDHVVRKALNTHPDLVCLTGDYVHGRGGAQFIEKGAAVFQPLLDARIPVAAVLGNHDWYANGEAMSKALSDRGITMLDNGRMRFDASTRRLAASDGEGLILAGVGDLWEATVDVHSALGGLPSSQPRLLLSHNPDVAELPALARCRVDLQLSGHTHGGQVVLPIAGPVFTLSKYGQRYATGVNQGPQSPVVTSRGIGMSVIPVRVLCSPELVCITLTRA